MNRKSSSGAAVWPHGTAATPLPKLRLQAERCRNCPLWEHATQTVFGEGPSNAEIVIVGEQPGSQEDFAGKPFVGPAGKLLDRALNDAGIDRSKVWVTNAVKHFKWKPRGKLRLHQKPAAGEIEACKPWLQGELAAISPRVAILLGATATRSLLGPKPRVTRDRGIFPAPDLAPKVIVTVHPSSLLRRSHSEDDAAAYARFVEDLSLATGE